MSEIFITSDTHFCHDKPFVWEPRGFTSIEEMNETIIERWNSVVKPNDMIFHLGDTMLSDNNNGIECLRRLNGQICLVYGNHDTNNRIELIHKELPSIITLGYAHLFKYKKMSTYLSHYPTLTSNMDDTGLWHRVISLHGHTHQKTNFLYPDNPFIYHVGVDSHNCYPVNIEEVIADIKNRYYEISHLGIERRPLYDFTKE